MNAIIAILYALIVSITLAAAIGYTGLYERVHNLFLLVFGWIVNASVAVIMYRALSQFDN